MSTSWMATYVIILRVGVTAGDVGLVMGSVRDSGVTVSIKLIHSTIILLHLGSMIYRHIIILLLGFVVLFSLLYL